MTACVSTLLASAPSASAADSGARPRVAVVEALDLPQDAAQFHAKARTTLETAVSQRGFELVKPANETSCATDACLKEVASSSGATDVLAVTGAPSDYRGFKTDVEIWHASTGESEHSSAVCNFCDGQQMLKQIQSGVDPMLAHLARRAASAAVTPPPAPAVVPPPAVAPISPPPVVTTPVEHPERAPLPAIGLTIGGAVVAAVGVSLLVADGRCSQSSCDPNVPHQVYDTEKIGLPATIIGGVAALAGAGWWIYEAMNPHQAISISVGPSGLSVAGRY